MQGREELIPDPPPPDTPRSRAEKKNPPKPPTVFTKRIGMGEFIVIVVTIVIFAFVLFSK